MNNRKHESLKNQIIRRIKDRDNSLQSQTDIKKTMDYAMERLAYSNILSFNFDDQSTLPDSHQIIANAYYEIGCMNQAIHHGMISLRMQTTIQKKNKLQLLLSKCYIKMQNYPQAIHKLKKIEKQLLLSGKIDDILEVKKIIAEAYKKQEKYQFALAIIDQINQINVRNYGMETLNYAFALIQKADILSRQQKFEEAQIIQQQAIDKLINLSYANVNVVSNLYISLAYYQREIQNFDSEYSSLMKAKTIYNQLYPQNSKQTIQIKYLLSKNLQKNGKIQESLKQCLDIMQIEKIIYGEITIQVARSNRRIGNLSVLLGKNSAALKHYLAAINIYQQNGEKVSVIELEQLVRKLREKKTTISKSKSMMKQK